MTYRQVFSLEPIFLKNVCSFYGYIPSTYKSRNASLVNNILSVTGYNGDYTQDDITRHINTIIGPNGMNTAFRILGLHPSNSYIQNYRTLQNRLNFNGQITQANIISLLPQQEPYYPERVHDDEYYDEEQRQLDQFRQEIEQQQRDRQVQEPEITAIMNVPASPSKVQVPHEERQQRRDSRLRELEELSRKRQARIDKLKNIYNQTDKSKEFVEWLRNKDAPANEEHIHKFIDSIGEDTIIDFTTLNKNDRAKAFPLIKEKLESIIGDLAMTNQFKISYRVNGVWKSRTLTSEIWNSLMNSFDEQEFIYGNEIHNTGLVSFSDDANVDVFKLVHFDAISFRRIQASGSTRKDNRDSFFPYLNTSGLDLSRYQIFDSIVEVSKHDKAKQRKELNDSCFVYALMMAGVDDDTLNKIRLRIHTRKLGLAKMDAICEEFGLCVIVHDLEYTQRNSIIRVNNKNFFGVPKHDSCTESASGIQDGLEIHLNSYKGHYFIDEYTEFTSDYINHKYAMHEELDESYCNKRYTSGKWKATKEQRRFITSGNLVKLLFENNYFTPITYNNSRILSTTLYKEAQFVIDDLHYNEKHCTKLMEPKKKNKKEVTYTYFYADFEADVSTKPHKPYMCCVQSIDGRIKMTFKGEGCELNFLNWISGSYRHPCIYFHNLKYDFSFIAKYGMTSSIQKGTRLMRAEIMYNNTQIQFRDTLPILSCKLSQLPSMFNIIGVQKELFPYKFYTCARLRENKGIINEAGAHEDKKWGPSEYKLFNENIDKIPGCRIDEHSFDMYKYAEFYCQQDVNILRQAFNKFADDFAKEFDINPFDFISISSLANEVFKRKVYYPNGNLFEVGGHLREFMSKAVYGGRCMTAYNKKWHVKDIPISDYDAVSLYPSAMSRLYTVEGRPEVLTYSGTNLKDIPEELKKYSAYIVEIKITNVGKHYPFPLIVQKTESGNLNCDDIDEEHPCTMVLDNIYLEDLVNFQHITFDVIRGYGWTGKKDYRIKDVIKQIFDKRLEYKKTNNPLQQLYKLIMNSCYGKCIEKPVMKEAKYVVDKDVKTKRESYNSYRRYLEKHYDEIVEDIEIGSNVHEIKRLCPTDKHFNNSLLGIQILSMSKRIMNEVMCLAFDIGCRIFYQDTDSMHIFLEDLAKLEKAYKEKYGRDLKGKQLCQFHSDFPEVEGGAKGEVPYSIESIFLMKKLYVDKLTDSSGKIDFMIRGKGLTQECIKSAASKVGGFIELYEYMYQGNEVIFDLADGAPSFVFSKDFTVSSNEHFYRKVSTPYAPGNINEYFTN